MNGFILIDINRKISKIFRKPISRTFTLQDCCASDERYTVVRFNCNTRVEGIQICFYVTQFAASRRGVSRTISACGQMRRK